MVIDTPPPSAAGGVGVGGMGVPSSGRSSGGPPGIIGRPMKGGSSGKLGHSSSGGGVGGVGSPAIGMGGVDGGMARERLVGDSSASVPGYGIAGVLNGSKGMGRRGGSGGGGSVMGGGGAVGEGWRRYVYPSGTVYEGDMVDDKREVGLCLVLYAIRACLRLCQVASHFVVHILSRFA